MNRPAVLVVDDKENMLKLFAKILGEEHNLTTASDGAKALALIAEHEFDVVVTDLKMPGPVDSPCWNRSRRAGPRRRWS